MLRWWKAGHDAGAKLVPIAPTGWDPRHYFQPIVEELQQLIRASINFTCTYNQTVDAQTIIIYAWNECSETSGSLIPSLGNGTLYIDTLSKILPMTC